MKIPYLPARLAIGKTASVQPLPLASRNCGLYRLDPDLRVTKVDAGIICSNGPCWNVRLAGDLVRYAPDGSVERRIGMPVRNTTSRMFGGERYRLSRS